MIKKEKGYFDLEENQKLLSTYVDLSSNAIQKLRLINATKHSAVTDPLTGIYNRRFFDEMLGKLLAVAKRRNEALGLLMIDLDHFKNINDTYGHTVGDSVLIHLSEGILLKLTVSIGVSSYPEYGQERDDLVNTADKALYKAKENGRNRVESP